MTTTPSRPRGRRLEDVIMATVKHEKYQRLIDTCKSLPPTPTAVAHPCDVSSLEGAMAAARMG